MKLIKNYQNEHAKQLNIIAIIELVASVAMAIFVWYNYGTMDVSYGTYYTYSETVMNPLGVSAGTVVLVQGIIFYLVISALASMAEDIDTIKVKVDVQE